MKQIFSFLTIWCLTLFLFSVKSEAQLLKKLKEEVKNRVENKIVKETSAVMDGDEQKNKPVTATAQSTEKTPATAASNYKNYDFVAGDKIIFQPDLRGETDAEIPARFTLVRGNAEIQSEGGEKFVHLNKGSYVTIMPLMSSEEYLPEQFTIEFDLMYENDKPIFDQFNSLSLYFFKKEDKNYAGYGIYRFTIQDNIVVYLGDNRSTRIEPAAPVKAALNTPDKWHHIALYIRKNMGKAYINEHRVAASNTMPVGAAKVAILSDGRYGYKIKNFRLAAGGDDKYQKIITDGKFITHGILFDVNQSTLKPESMGALNEIAKLMNEHTDLSFEINGHTDSDGNPTSNQALSEARAEAVKKALTDMGIQPSRLKTKGNGASKPIDKNDTAEGKANNRRVEFVKL